MTDLKQPDPRLVDVATVLNRHRFDREMSNDALARAVLETADLPRETPTLKGGRRKAAPEQKE